MGGYHDVEFPHEEPGFFPRSPPFQYPDGLPDGIADFSITDPALGLEQHGPVSMPVVQPILVPPQPPAQETPMAAVVDATAPPGGTNSGINGGSGAPTNGNRGPSPACSYGSSPAPAASPAAVKDDGNDGSNDKQGSDGNDESNNTGDQSTASWSIVHSLPRLTRWLSDASSLCFKALPMFFEAVFIHWIGGLGTFLEAWIFLFKASPRLISVTKQLS
ncbi:uncharacterized protein QC763_203395 [Podospora pseudopauciseta]|uniref:Uncharacterized protein n=1 Tax=Podospora pseudopauciseta TaxID=2093780 RepID=A0ABR0HN13_9PEZI|nr:hypothetical protein QC763_203395 [Podospora pseudopauciseta]